MSVLRAGWGRRRLSGRRVVQWVRRGLKLPAGGPRHDLPRAASGASISLIGAAMRVEGDLEASGTIRIDGVVLGNVRAGGQVVIGPLGQLQGDLTASAALLAGRACGDIVAGRAEFDATAAFEGTLSAARLRIADGASVNGLVRTGSDAAGRLGGTSSQARHRPALAVVAGHRP